MKLLAHIAAGLVMLIPSITMAQISSGGLDGRVNSINTAVPFLRIVPNARSGAMGDAGLAISPDANAVHLNASKLAFIEKDFGLSISYTPWLRSLQVDDVYLTNLAAFKQVEDGQKIGLSFSYFSLGNIVFTDISGAISGAFMPNEFQVTGIYSRTLSKRLSLGVGLKYIYSNLAANQVVSGITIRPGKTAAGDISAYYRNNEMRMWGYDAEFAFGAAISNIGSKISYTNSVNKSYIPTNLGLGVAQTIEFDEYNKLTLALDMNKLLVPTPDTTDADGNGILDYREHTTASGVISSFTDAPGGFREEINELMFSFGLEYWYTEHFAARAGYFYEHATKGNRKFFTLGLGVKYNVFGLNFSYLLPSSSTPNPLDNTMRFTLLFDFSAAKDGGGDEGGE